MARPNSVWWNKQKQTWCVEIEGKRFTLAKGRAKKSEAVKALTAILRERALLAKVDGAISVAGLCERFLVDTEERLSSGTLESYTYSCQKFVDELGDRPAHTICREDISRFTRTLRRTLNDSSIGIILRSVQRCFNWGVEERIIPPHDLGRIRKPRSVVRQRLVTDEEFRSLLRCTNSSRDDRIGAAFRRYLLAMDWTGCRPTELARLTWDDIHFEHSIALLWKHKTDRTGDPKVIPLIPKLKRLLLWLKSRSDSPYVFINSRGNPWNRHSIAKRVVAARKKAGLSSDVVPYTVRHRVATKALARTGDLKMTSEMLGHKSVTVTERYIHMASGALVDFSTRALG
jgi:site-specific recombinase XerD